MLPLVGKTVLAAVQFDIQFRLLTKEIKMVNSDWVLAAKFIAAEATIAQPAPDQFFRPSFILAKLAGSLDVGHGANLENGDAMGKFDFTSALTFYPLPQERK